VRSFIRLLVRVAALAVLVILLAGVPVAVLLTVGAPWPSAAQWRDAWQSRTVDTGFVVHLGSAMFLLLWSWFAVTALAEMVRVTAARRDPERLAAMPRGEGPVRWVRGLVRVAAIGSVSASALMTGLAGHGLAAPGAAPVVLPSGVATHVVEPGDSYWAIADAHLTTVFGRDPTPTEVHMATEALMDWNVERLGHRDPSLILPGETVLLEPADAPASPAPVIAEQVPMVGVPVVELPTVDAPVVDAPAVVVPASVVTTVPAPTPTTVAPSVASVPGPTVVVDDAPSHDDGIGVTELGAAVLLSAGALAAVRGARRRGLRASLPGDAVVTPTFEQARTELQLRALHADERVARVDIALRAAARDLAAQHAAVLAVWAGERGDIRLHLRGAAVPSDPRWHLDVVECTWTLGAQVSLGDLGVAAGDALQPCPALWHVGTTPDGGDLYVDAEAWGTVAVDTPNAAGVLRAAVASFAYSPFRDHAKLLVAGVATDPRLPDVERLGDMADALPVAVGAAAGVALAARRSSTLELRASATGELYEPTLLVIDAPIDVDQLVEIGGGRGLAVLLCGDVDAACVLKFDGARHVVHPLGLEVRPVGLDDTQVSAVVDLVDSAAAPITSMPIAREVCSADDTFIDPTRLTYDDPPWALMVKVLGPVDVVAASRTRVEFDRSKALELVVWLSQHRKRPTRSSARADLWDVGVRDASFANVVSEARRSMARVVAPPDGDEWIGRTLTDDLPLHPLVVTDAELLALRTTAARSMPRPAAMEVLRDGLALVTDLPFAGTSYLWPDAGGHTSSLVLLATGAAAQLAEWYLEADDIDGVFWATGQGLRVLPGHEELVALRMRAHAARGDLAGVRQEWEAYERSLLADSWSLAAPSPKLTTLRRDLLATPAASGRR
jgi:hypothetical protein